MPRPVINPPYNFRELRSLVSEAIHQRVKSDTLYEWTIQAMVRSKGERKRLYSYRERVMLTVFAIGLKRYGEYEAARNFLVLDLDQNPLRYIPNDKNASITITIDAA